MTHLCAGTPEITVCDNRGLAVRTLRYNRSKPGDVSALRVQAQVSNDLGQLVSSQDARFFAEGKGTFNFHYRPALSGRVLRTVSADAGVSLVFADIEGRPARQQNARNTIHVFAYDALSRPVSRTEIPDGDAAVVRERWIYGDTEPPATAYDRNAVTDPRNANLRSRVIQHFDTAGLLDTSAVGYTPQGAARQQDRRLLPLETASDWTRGTRNDWQALLAPAHYPTTRAYDALDRALAQTDARGHQQRRAYDLAGRKSADWVTPRGQREKGITNAITYTASGQVGTKADANGITTTYTYEPQTTRRMLEIKVARIQGAVTVLQDLVYVYDAVGNVVNLTDTAAQIAYFKNQATTAARAYTYDALYQLLSASGRENAAVSSPPNTDNPGVCAPPDPANYRRYSRSYAYDLGGNLTQIIPGNGLPNRIMTVSAASNRAVSNINAANVTAATVENYFDAAGNATCLDGNANQPTRWNGLNRLDCLVTLRRSVTDPTQNDRESYAYDGDGRRVRKSGFAKAAGTWNQSDAIYLPGLEIRAPMTGEQIEVIVLDDGARMLTWASDRPDGIDDRQVRYRYGDRQDSCQIETDESARIITQEEYYAYGGTAVWTAASQIEARYKTVRYSGKERDAAGLYYYGFRYYQPWTGRWTNPDPAGTADGQNLYCMVGNNPVTRRDSAGLAAEDNDGEPAEKRAKLARTLAYGWESDSISSPLPALDPDLRSYLDDMDNAVGGSFQGKKKALSMSAFERHEKIIGATHKEIDEGQYEFDEKKRGGYESEDLKSAIHAYTYSAHSVNPPSDERVDEDSEFIDILREMQTAIEILPGLPAEAMPKLYRGDPERASGEYPHVGLGAGDILISQQFISFTEVPHVLGEYTDFRRDEADKTGEVRKVHACTAYFVASNASSARPVGPFAEDSYLEAEWVVPMGTAFQVESARKISYNGHNFTQIEIKEVAGFSMADKRSPSVSGSFSSSSLSSLDNRRVVHFHTGEPFNLDELRARLDKDQMPIFQRRAPR